MTLIPNYSVTVGSISLDPSQGDDAEGLSVQLSMEAPADCFEAVLRPSSATSGVRAGDPVTISLGYDSQLSRIFSGIIDIIEISSSHLRILGLGQMVKLLKLRTNQIYLKQTAGKIAKDLCAKAQVSVGEVQDGVALPSFFVSHEVSAYEYVRELAERSGFDLYVTSNSKLNFKMFKPQATHSLEYGHNVLGVQAIQVSSPEAIRVFGESPSSVKGSDTTHWLTKDNVEGSAGSGQAMIFTDPAVKDKSTADAVAKSRLSRARQALRVSVTALGSPQVRLGDAVSLKGFKHPLLKGDFKVSTIEHVLRKEEGFITRLVCSKEA